MKNTIIILFLCLFTACTSVQHNNKMDTYLETLAQNNAFMGDVALMKTGKSVYNKSVGFAVLSDSLKINNQTRFSIGSIAKTFTSVLVFKAIEEGKIGLTDKLDKFFPRIKNADLITIDNMLTHRSGIYNITDTKVFNQRFEGKSREELIGFIEQENSLFAPGSEFRYSNSNYLLLSYILEDLYGISFAEILSSVIVKPLNLKNTTFGVKDLPVSDSYIFNSGWKKEGRTSATITMGAGGIYSTAEDLNKFFYSLFTGKILSQKSLDDMTKENAGIASGLFVMPFYAIKGYGHTGGIDGYRSIAVYFPSIDLSCTILSNALNYNLNDITIAMLSGFFNKPFEIPDFSQIKIDPSVLNEYCGVYSSTQLPIKVTITVNNGGLVGQGTGQSSFTLDAVSENIFRNIAVGIVLEFDSLNNSMTLKQAGQNFLMKRE